MAANFSSIPVLDYTWLSTSERPTFILQLRHALINVGFLYLKNPPVDLQPLLAGGLIPKFFALSPEEKLAVRMANSPHFLGWNAQGMELTKGQTDEREQVDFATPHESRWKKSGDPEHWKLWGPSQWPSEASLPGFEAILNKYLAEVQDLSYEFIELIAEAFGLSEQATGERNQGRPRGPLGAFFDEEAHMQHRAKIVKYLVVSKGASDQGVGPHYDAGFLTFLLQASQHPGLQVQNLSGQWIDASPIENTFVVNIGKALEFVTQGLARATSHRVLSPKDVALGPRYSVPFFQNISLDARLDDVKLEFPPEILALKELRGEATKTDSVNFTEFDHEPSGKVNLIGRVKSHPDVAQIHYPELFNKIFPGGLPSQGGAY